MTLRHAGMLSAVRQRASAILGPGIRVGQPSLSPLLGRASLARSRASAPLGRSSTYRAQPPRALGRASAVRWREISACSGR